MLVFVFTYSMSQYGKHKWLQSMQHKCSHRYEYQCGQRAAALMFEHANADMLVQVNQPIARVQQLHACLLQAQNQQWLECKY